MKKQAEKLRFGIVGCGVIGPTHAEAIASLDEAQLVAVVDVLPERAQKLADKYGAAAYTNMQEMLASEPVDIVIICAPSGLHGELACQAMRAGKHVIVEKPMEISRAAIEEMLRVQQESGVASTRPANDATASTASQSGGTQGVASTRPANDATASTASQSGGTQGVKLAVISQHRFDFASRQVKKLLEENAFGRLVLGNATVPWWRSQSYYDSGDWRGTWALDGGGVLMNQSIHYIDLLQWFMGPVKTVFAYNDTLVHRMETEDVAVAILRFANGALGTIAATTAAYPGVTTRVEIYGDKGSAIIEDDSLSYLHLARDESGQVGSYGSSAKKKGNTPVGRSASQNPAALSVNSHALQIADMIRAIRENGTPLVDGYAAKRPVEIILAIYESARTHKEVALS